MLATVALVAAASMASAQTFTQLHNFDITDGANPYAALVQATDGNLYGTTEQGGANSCIILEANGCGTVFKITPSGTLTTLHSFDFTDGAGPNAGLIQATDGNFYGTTGVGGANTTCNSDYGCGTIFKITPGGTVTTLYNFCSQSNCPDGEWPSAGLVQATNGNLYGTTSAGANAAGTVFKITPGGTLTTLYSFCSQSGCTDGSVPSGTLVQATDGNLYGTTGADGANGGGGTVFKITPKGTLTTLYSFCSQGGCADGSGPSGLIQATDGNFYGTTYLGGAYGYGSVFKITPSGTLTTLYSFCSQSGCPDGRLPSVGLTQATDGNFYGTTPLRGSHSQGGTVFKITPRGTLTTLHRFCTETGCPDGAGAAAGLMQATNGNLYATTGGGGAYSDGTVFSLSVGLGPFVETQPTSSKVGAAVKILGTNLTGTTAVSFNGKTAVFEVVSKSLIKAKVPASATTGFVTVTTPGGTLTSNVPFRVRP
jgi:uncharacterized repeat protein (TIGR03803 family)